MSLQQLQCFVAEEQHVTRAAERLRISQPPLSRQLSRDETIMGFGFPKDLRNALVESDPDKILLPGESDLRSTRSACGSTNLGREHERQCPILGLDCGMPSPAGT